MRAEQLQPARQHVSGYGLAWVAGHGLLLRRAVDADDQVDVLERVSEERRTGFDTQGLRDVGRQSPAQYGSAMFLCVGEGRLGGALVIGMAGDAARVEYEDAVNDLPRSEGVDLLDEDVDLRVTQTPVGVVP